MWGFILRRQTVKRVITGIEEKNMQSYDPLHEQRRLMLLCWIRTIISHDEFIKWKHFPRYWPFVRGIHRSPVNSPDKDQWRGALMFSLICVWINGSVNNGEAGDLRRHQAHCDVTVMSLLSTVCFPLCFMMSQSTQYLFDFTQIST